MIDYKTTKKNINKNKVMEILICFTAGINDKKENCVSKCDSLPLRC